MARTLELDTITEPSNSGTANITLSSNTTTTMPLVDINGGAIDNTALGATTPSTVSASTLTASGATTLNGDVTLGNASGDTITVTGTVPSATITSAAVTTINGCGIQQGGGSGVNANSVVRVGVGALGNGVGSDSRMTVIGWNASYTAGENDITVVGAKASYSAVGSHNGTTAIGANALYYNYSGAYNVAVGASAMAGGVGTNNGGNNVAVGNHALSGNMMGHNNTCVGSSAGTNITGDSGGSNGSNNICIGYESGTSNAPSGSLVQQSNVVCLGDSDITALYCADTSISSSDGRDKTDVEDFTAGLDWIEAMRPVTFHWDKRSWYTEYDEETGEITSEKTPDGTHKKDKKNLGFIAQEVLAIEQANGFASDKNDMLTVNMNEDDTAYGMKYERLVPVLVNAVKELSAKVKALESA